jgi:hypothetical protein
MCSLSRWFRDDTRRYLERLHHSPVTAREVVAFLLMLYDVMTHQLEGGSNPLSTVCRRLNEMGLEATASRLRTRASETLVFVFHLGYAREGLEHAHHRYSLILDRDASRVSFWISKDMAEGRPACTEEMASVAHLRLFLLIRKVRALGSQEPLLSLDVLKCVLGRRRACMRRERDYSLLHRSRLVHQQLSALTGGLPFSIEDLIGYRLVYRAPGTLGDTTSLVDARVADRQWREEELEGHLRAVTETEEADVRLLRSLNTLLQILYGGRVGVRQLVLLDVLELLDRIKNRVYLNERGKSAMMRTFDRRYGAEVVGTPHASNHHY